MNKRIYPLLAVLLGAAGFGLQCRAQTTAFEPLTGLIVPGTASMLVLKIFIVAVPVIALLCALPLKGSGARIDATGRLFEHLGFPARFVGVLAGMLYCAAALLRLTGDVRTGGGLAVLAVDVLLIVGGAGMVWQIVTPGSRRSLLTLLPGFSIAFWLVIYYHTQSKDPIVERYGALLLCLMAAALALYHQAGWSFGKANPVRGMTFTLTAGIYAFAAMPAAAGTADLLALTAIGLWMLLHAAVLPGAPEKTAEKPEEE